jgi:hypothetical protein
MHKGPGSHMRAAARRDALLVSFEDFEFEGLTMDELRTLYPGIDTNPMYKDIEYLAETNHWLDRDRPKGRQGIRWHINAAGKVEAARARTRLQVNPFVVPPPVREAAHGADWKVVAEELRDYVRDLEAKNHLLGERILQLEAERAEHKVSRDEIRAFLRREG